MQLVLSTAPTGYSSCQPFIPTSQKWFTLNIECSAILITSSQWRSVILSMRTIMRATQNTHKQPATPRASIQRSTEESDLVEAQTIPSRVAKKSGPMTPQDVLHLQGTIGNQAVVRMLAQRKAVRREDDDENQASGQEQQQ